MNFVLIGYRGSGKSSVGLSLAQRLRWKLVDTDDLLQQSGESIRDIIMQRGETGFRALEAQVIRDVAALDQHIISTGGGVVLRDENVVALKSHGKLIWLTAPADVLWKRILGDTQRLQTRPTPDLNTGFQKVQADLQERNPIYSRVADLVVDTTGQSIERLADLILAQAEPWLMA